MFENVIEALFKLLQNQMLTELLTLETYYFGQLLNENALLPPFE